MLIASPHSISGFRCRAVSAVIYDDGDAGFGPQTGGIGFTNMDAASTWVNAFDITTISWGGLWTCRWHVHRGAALAVTPNAGCFGMNIATINWSQFESFCDNQSAFNETYFGNFPFCGYTTPIPSNYTRAQVFIPAGNCGWQNYFVLALQHISPTPGDCNAEKYQIVEACTSSLGLDCSKFTPCQGGLIVELPLPCDYTDMNFVRNVFGVKGPADYSRRPNIAPDVGAFCTNLAHYIPDISMAPYCYGGAAGGGYLCSDPEEGPFGGAP